MSDEESDVSDNGSVHTFATISDISGDENDSLRKPRSRAVHSLPNQPQMSCIECKSKDKIITELQNSHKEAQYEIKSIESSKQLELSRLQRELLSVAGHARSKEIELASKNHKLEQEVKALSVTKGTGIGEASLKNSLRNITINESLYLEYSDKPEELQSIREVVCIRFYEVMREERAQREAVTQELESMRVRVQQLEAENEKRSFDLRTVTKSKRSREEELASQLEITEAKLRTATLDLTDKSIKMEQMSREHTDFGQLQKRATNLDEQVVVLSEKNRHNDQTIQALEASKKSIQHELLNAERKCELLQTDKMHLQKVEALLSDRLQIAELDKRRLEDKIEAVKKSNEDLIQRLLNVDTERRTMYQDKLEAELSSLQQKTREDLDSIRINQKEAFEREIKGLRESRDLSLSETNRLRASSEHLNAEYQLLLEQHRKLQSDYENGMQAMNTQLKLKSFDMERLAITHEETLATVRKLKSEVEMQSKTNKVLQEEYYQLESRSEQAQRQLLSDITALREKLATFDELEQQLDMAIINAGGAEDADSTDGEARGVSRLSGMQKLIDVVGTNLGANGKRRAKQTILLSQKLVLKQNEIHSMKQALETVNGKNQELIKRVAQLQEQITMVQQPQSYLIAAIAEKEELCTSTRAELAESRSELKKKSADCAQLKKALGKAELDIKVFCLYYFYFQLAACIIYDRGFLGTFGSAKGT
jgi:hypothetical protein